MKLDPFNIGLLLAGAGATAGGAASGNPLAVALGLQTAGAGLGLMGTSTRETGPTDDQIAGVQRGARRARTADINTQARQRQRMAAAQAAQGGTLQSGLYGAAARDIDAARAGSLDALESDLAGQALGLMSQRRTVTEAGPVAVAGRLVSSLSYPIGTIGAEQLAREGFGAPAFGGDRAAPASMAARAAQGLAGRVAPATQAAAPAPRPPAWQAQPQSSDMDPDAYDWMRSSRRRRGQADPFADALGYGSAMPEGVY